MPIKKYKSRMEKERARLRSQERAAHKRRMERATARLLSLPSPDKLTRTKREKLVGTYWEAWDTLHKTETLLENELFRTKVFTPGGVNEGEEKHTSPLPNLLPEMEEKEIEEREPPTMDTLTGILDRGEDDKS